MHLSTPVCSRYIFSFCITKCGHRNLFSCWDNPHLRNLYCMGSVDSYVAAYPVSPTGQAGLLTLIEVNSSIISLYNNQHASIKN